MSYQDDKRELLKLKQGIIEESETIAVDEEKPVYELHGFKKIENFFYHYKWHVIVGLFFTAVIIFFAHNLLTKEQGDMRVLLVTKSPEVTNNVTYKIKEFEMGVEKFCPDFDDNGYIHVDMYNIDLSENISSEYMLAGVTKATSEIMYGEAQMFIVDKQGLEALTDGTFEGLLNLEELFPDCPYVDGIYLKVKDSPLSAAAGYMEACPEDLYIVVRNIADVWENKERAEKANEKALHVIRNIVDGYMEGWVDDQGRIYGVENENPTV